MCIRDSSWILLSMTCPVLVRIMHGNNNLNKQKHFKTHILFEKKMEKLLLAAASDDACNEQKLVQAIKVKIKKFVFNCVQYQNCIY